MEERTVGPLLPAKFDLDRLRGRGLRPPKLKMGNVTHILPVLHCLKRGIAFVSSLSIIL